MAIKKWFHFLVQVCRWNLSGLSTPMNSLSPSFPLPSPHLSRNSFPFLIPKTKDYHLFNSFLSWTGRGLMAGPIVLLFLTLMKKSEHPADFQRCLRVTSWIDLFVPSFQHCSRLEQWRERGIVRINTHVRACLHTQYRHTTSVHTQARVYLASNKRIEGACR